MARIPPDRKLGAVTLSPRSCKGCPTSTRKIAPERVGHGQGDAKNIRTRRRLPCEVIFRVYAHTGYQIGGRDPRSTRQLRGRNTAYRGREDSEAQKDTLRGVLGSY